MHALGTCQLDERADIVRSDPDVAHQGLSGGAGITRRHQHLGNARRGGAFPGECVLAPAAADDHGAEGLQQLLQFGELASRAEDVVHEHDGLAGRLVSFDAQTDRLRLVLQPARWALRLTVWLSTTRRPRRRASGLVCRRIICIAKTRSIAGRFHVADAFVQRFAARV